MDITSYLNSLEDCREALIRFRRGTCTVIRSQDGRNFIPLPDSLPR